MLCLLASFTSGIRWTMAQMIMQKSKLGLKNPIDMMYYMQPWMILSIFPIALLIEGGDIYEGLTELSLHKTGLVVETTSAVISGAILAFSMEVLEFLVVTYASSLTLSVSGIFKVIILLVQFVFFLNTKRICIFFLFQEICILIIAYEWKGDQMSGLNFIGLFLCLGGIILHVVHKVMINNRESVNDLELRSNSLDSKLNEATSFPLNLQKSSSLTSLLNDNFSSDDDGDDDEGNVKKENSDQLLSTILQRRE